MALNFSDLVFGRRTERVADLLETGELVRITRGCFLPRSLVEEQTTRWGLRRLVTEARILAVLAGHAVHNPGIAALDAALVLQGVPILHSTPDIHYWREKKRVAPTVRVLEAVQVGSHTVPPAEVRELTGLRSSQQTGGLWGQANDDGVGPRFAGLGETILDLARFAHPLLAFVNGSLALRHLVRFDRFQRAASEARTLSAKSEILTGLDALSIQRNLTRARQLVGRLEPAVESPAEAIVLWAIEVLTRGANPADLKPKPKCESQYEVVSQGNQYFLDVAFPEARIAIEFDGAAKMAEGQAAQQRFLRRQADLTRDGWHVRRLTTGDYLDVRKLFQILSRDLQSRGIGVMAPGGALWRPVLRSMLDPARLF